MTQAPEFSAANSNSASSIQFVTEQPASESLARVFLGAAVQNSSGETIGDVNDLVFDRSGHISTVVLGVGGFHGIGRKVVAVPFSALVVNSGKDGARTIVVPLDKESLEKAPGFKAIEKTTLDSVKDLAVLLAHKASQKAAEITDQAKKKIEEMQHRDGNVGEQLAFGATEAKKLATDKGYEPLVEPRPVDEHFELLGKKDGVYYDLGAHRDGKVDARLVDATDPKWGGSIH
jgi:sporulation protein YlmC with PRC-barrel domain